MPVCSEKGGEQIDHLEVSGSSDTVVFLSNDGKPRVSLRRCGQLGLHIDGLRSSKHVLVWTNECGGAVEIWRSKPDAGSHLALRSSMVASSSNAADNAADLISPTSRGSDQDSESAAKSSSALDKNPWADMGEDSVALLSGENPWADMDDSVASVPLPRFDHSAMHSNSWCADTQPHIDWHWSAEDWDLTHRWRNGSGSICTWTDDTQQPRQRMQDDWQIWQDQWRNRCQVHEVWNGEKPTIRIMMNKIQLGDREVAHWCEWMTLKLYTDQLYTAEVIDFSENYLTATGAETLCAFFTRYSVTCMVLKLHKNLLDDEALKYIARYLTSFNQAPVQELHLSHNHIMARGIQWLFPSLGMHPAYPAWNQCTQSFAPLWLRLDHNKCSQAEAVAMLRWCEKLDISVCLMFDNSACTSTKCAEVHRRFPTGKQKHNCVAHMRYFVRDKAAVSGTLRQPQPHARPFFAVPQVSMPELPRRALRGCPVILYEDVDVACIYKPADWLCSDPYAKDDPWVDPAWGLLDPSERKRKLRELLEQKNAAPLGAWFYLHFGCLPIFSKRSYGLAQRLDRFTSGPLLLSKTHHGYEHCAKQIRERDVLKDYVALLHGRLSERVYECRAPIEKVRGGAKISERGEPAITLCEALAYYEDVDSGDVYTLAHLRIVTGRTHQIRVHMLHLGHPVVGDMQYVTDQALIDRDCKFCDRVFLHKFRIAFCDLNCSDLFNFRFRC